MSGRDDYTSTPGLTEVLLENITDAVVITELATRTLRFWNRAAEALYGWKREEALGQTYLSLLQNHFEAGTTFERMLATIEAEGVWNGLVTQTTRAGDWLLLECSVRKLGAEALVTITHRASSGARAEAAMRASEATLRSFFDSAPQALYVVRADFRVLAFNRVAEKEALAARGRPVRAGDDARELVNPVNLPGFLEAFERCLKGERVQFERRIVYPGGTTAWFEFSYTPVRAGDESILGVAFSALDITSRKREAEALFLREQAIEATTTGMVIADARLPDMPVIFVNPAFTAMTGYPASEVLGKNLRLLQGSETDREEIARVRERIAAGQPVQARLKNYRKDGSTFWNLISLSPVRDESGQLTHYVGVQQDDSARVALEDQLRHAQKLEGIGRLAGGIAHDFNNLLTVILNSAELLSDAVAADAEGVELREEILAAGRRAAELTHQLLAFSRRQVLQPRVIEPGQILTSMGRMLGRVIREDISLQLETDGRHGLVRVDPGQLEQVIMNLVVNARDALPEGGELRLQTTSVTLEASAATRLGAPAGDYVRLTVSDTGVGMDPSTLDHIFEPFFTTKGVGKGTGMGLATVHGIVRQSGGVIDVHSTRGRGTIFELYFPRVEPEATPRSEQALAEPRGGDEEVALVEDDAAVRKLAAAILRKHGYTVLEFSSAGEAVAAFTERGEHIGLLLTDVVMPGVSGLELARRLRASWPGLKVLLMSGYSAESLDAQLGLPLLTKPFTPESLTARVREVLDGTSSRTT